MKNFLNISDVSKSEFLSIIENAQNLISKKEPVLNDKNIGLIFEKNSTRTRLSFQVGINQLQGNYIDINLESLNLNRFETFEDTFEMMGCYLDAIVFRTTDHKKLELAKKYFKKPIINALSDVSHPCQAVSDIFTLQEQFSRINNLKIVWMGDMNNVLYSLVEAAEYLDDVFIDIFTDEKIYQEKIEIFKKFSHISINHEINTDLLERCDCVMTDVFLSMNDNDSDKESLLKRFQVNSKVMSITKDEAVFMHCLPAKIDSEVAEDVIKGPKSIVVKQAENRLHSQKGILKWLDI